MMPLKKSRGRLRLSWRKTKPITVIIVVVALAGALGYLVVTRWQKTSSKSLPATLPATTALSADDWQFSQVLVFLKEKGLTVFEPSISRGTMRFNLGVTAVILPLGNDLPDKLDTFWKVWKQYQILGKSLKSLDLRFSYPLVTY